MFLEQWAPFWYVFKDTIWARGGHVGRLPGQASGDNGVQKQKWNEEEWAPESGRIEFKSS